MAAERPETRDRRLKETIAPLEQSHKRGLEWERKGA
jgi:hypothetical protein